MIKIGFKKTKTRQCCSSVFKASFVSFVLCISKVVKFSSIFQIKLSQGCKHGAMVSIAQHWQLTLRLQLTQELSEWACLSVLLLLPLFLSLAYTQASSIENKQDWIKHIREVIQERTVHLKGALKEPIHIPKPSTTKHKARRYNLRPVKPSSTLLNVAVVVFFYSFIAPHRVSAGVQLLFSF